MKNKNIMVINTKVQRAESLLNSKSAQAYCSEINGYNTLNHDEQMELIKIIKGDDPVASEKAKTELIKANQKFILGCAKKYANGDDVMDLVDEANIGLIKAINNFDFEKAKQSNNNVITFAVHYIRKEITEYIATKRNVVTPNNAQRVYTYVRKAKEEFTKRFGYAPSPTETRDFIEEVYKIRIAHEEDVMDYIMTSIDTSSHHNDDNDENYVNQEYETATAYNDVEDNIEKEDVTARIESYLNILDDREQTIIRLSFGLGEINMPMHNDEIGERIGLSSERVRQIKARAIEKIQRRLGVDTAQTTKMKKIC